MSPPRVEWALDVAKRGLDDIQRPLNLWAHPPAPTEHALLPVQAPGAA